MGLLLMIWVKKSNLGLILGLPKVSKNIKMNRLLSQLMTEFCV